MYLPPARVLCMYAEIKTSSRFGISYLIKRLVLVYLVLASNSASRHSALQKYTALKLRRALSESCGDGHSIAVTVMKVIWRWEKWV
jgi:hypothetical protein